MAGAQPPLLLSPPLVFHSKGRIQVTDESIFQVLVVQRFDSVVQRINCNPLDVN